MLEQGETTEVHSGRKKKSRLIGFLLSLVLLGYFYARKPGLGVFWGFLTACLYVITFYVTIGASLVVFFPVAVFPWLFQVVHVQVLIGRWNSDKSSDGWPT